MAFFKIRSRNWLPQQRPMSDHKTNVRLIILNHMSTTPENLANILVPYTFLDNLFYQGDR